MRYEELTGKVQARAQLPDRGSAERASRAVLGTLAERVPEGLAENLLAQLPSELSQSVREQEQAVPGTDGAHGGTAERFDVTAFAGRVAWRGGVSEEAALREATAVFEVLDAAVAPELMEKVAHSLPADIRELLPAARAGDER